MNPTKAIQRQIEKDNTITIGDGITDCNGRVSEDSIALRELMIYSNLDKEVKEKIQTVLLNYGMMFEDEEERLYDCKEIIGELLDDSIEKTIWAYQYDLLNIFKPTITPIQIMEKVIEKILIKYYQNYNIPTENYDIIVYEHKSTNNPCDRLKHHYECLHNPSLEWNKLDGNKYDITVTYKDIKVMILQARDSGGNIDCFGYAHDGTTMNTVVHFVSEKLNIEHKYFTFDYADITEEEKQELEKICEEIYDIIRWNMSDFLVQIY